MYRRRGKSTPGNRAEAASLEPQSSRTVSSPDASQPQGFDRSFIPAASAAAAAGWHRQQPPRRSIARSCSIWCRSMSERSSFWGISSRQCCGPSGLLLRQRDTIKAKHETCKGRKGEVRGGKALMSIEHPPPHPRPPHHYHHHYPHMVVVVILISIVIIIGVDAVDVSISKPCHAHHLLHHHHRRRRRRHHHCRHCRHHKDKGGPS